MRAIRPGFEFGMELHRDKPWMIRKFNDFHQVAIRIDSGDAHAMLTERIPVMVVEFIAMAVAFKNILDAISGAGNGIIR